MGPRIARRRRCDVCGRLVECLHDHWPNGVARRPRFMLCDRCHDFALAEERCQQATAQ